MKTIKTLGLLYFSFIFVIQDVIKMKFWNTIFLLIFLNFTALPSIAAIFDWDISTSTMLGEEEEETEDVYDAFEKILPITSHEKETPLTIDYQNINKGLIYQEAIHLSPYLSLFSPPPEFKI